MKHDDQHRNNNTNLPSCPGCDVKIYPYGPVNPEYTIIYSVGFRGCFKYSQETHIYRNKHPLA